MVGVKVLEEDLAWVVATGEEKEDMPPEVSKYEKMFLDMIETCHLSKQNSFHEYSP